jgi:hypothetical protein
LVSGVKTSTNALTKRYMEMRGCLCETVQRFYGGRRHDLFGIADSVGVIGAGIVFIQNCSYGSLKAHRDAIDGDGLREAKERLVRAGAMVWLLEWRRKKAKRGGKRVARHWWVRMQSANGIDGWNDPTLWEGPLDLYPKKP